MQENLIVTLLLMLCLLASLSIAAWGDEVEARIQKNSAFAATKTEQQPDYAYMCKHKADNESYYSNCSLCVGEPICCDLNKAVDSDFQERGKRCMKKKDFGGVDMKFCAGQAIPPQCPYQFFCKVDPNQQSYYEHCNSSCVDTPICCNKDLITLDTNLNYGMRCMKRFPGPVHFSMCQARELPTGCPEKKYQYFCKYQADDDSHYSNCDTCVGEPICCDMNETIVDSDFPERGKRCMKKKDVGRVDMEFCAGQAVPRQCPYQFFCKVDPNQQSYYEDCTGACVDTPICCNRDLIKFDTTLDHGMRCREGKAGHVNFNMCDSQVFPFNCPGLGETCA